jgi:hypothetical protein
MVTVEAVDSAGTTPSSVGGAAAEETPFGSTARAVPRPPPLGYAGFYSPTQASAQQAADATPRAVPMMFDPTNMTAEQAQMLAMFQAMAFVNAEVYHPPPAPLVPPRVGGIDEMGVWTGHGLQKKGVTPNTHNCMRRFVIKCNTQPSSFHD